MKRLRLRVIGCPRRALALLDAASPDCPDCHGEGGIALDYGDESGEYAGTHWYRCDCSTPWCLVLLPLPRLPRLLRRRVAHRDPWTDEPPF